MFPGLLSLTRSKILFSTSFSVSSAGACTLIIVIFVFVPLLGRLLILSVAISFNMQAMKTKTPLFKKKTKQNNLFKREQEINKVKSNSRSWQGTLTSDVGVRQTHILIILRRTIIAQRIFFFLFYPCTVIVPSPYCCCSISLELRAKWSLQPLLPSCRGKASCGIKSSSIQWLFLQDLV